MLPTQTVDAITSLQSTADTALEVRSRAQDLILHSLSALSYSIGVAIATVYWAAVWACVILFVTNVVTNVRYTEQIAINEINILNAVVSRFNAWVAHVDHVSQAARLEVYNIFCQAILAVNQAAQLQRSDLGYIAPAFI